MTSKPLALILYFKISINVFFSGGSIEIDIPEENLETNLSSRPSSSAGGLSEVRTICLPEENN